MIKQPLTLALALATVTAQAAIIDTRPYWAASVSGLDAQYATTTHEIVGREVRTVLYFDITNDTSVDDIQIKLDMINGYSALWTEAFYSFSYTGHQNGGIAFSRTSVSFTEVNTYTGRTVTVDVSGLAPLVGGSALGNSWRPNIDLHLEDFQFLGGKGLNPSTDPTCAAFSCMAPYVVSAKLAIVFQGQVVPEAEPMAMLTGGLAVLSLAGWRRRTQKKTQPTDCDATCP